MQKAYRVVFEYYDENQPDTVLSKQTVFEDIINKPTNCLDFTIGFNKQIELIRSIQDCVLLEKTKLLNKERKECPECHIKLTKFGSQNSTIHDVLTDHKVAIPRMRCKTCNHEEPSTVRAIIGGTCSGDLINIQSKLGSEHTYRESEKILGFFSQKSRQINNHDRVKQVVHAVGSALAVVNEEEKEMIVADKASELILNVDGGHLKTVEDKRSIEAMVSVIYKPEALESNDKGTRNYLSSKNCAASIKDDNQKQIISSTIIAALKQGLHQDTHVTALCDGAENCWNVAKALEPLSGSMTYILDWFHISMKMKNISLEESLKSKFTRIKWHLWRGNTAAAIVRLNELIEATNNESCRTKISNFLTYVENNKHRIVDYRARQKAGLVFTSNLAESTVESLINQRCKGKQHMRWSREGLNPVLQLRAAVHSKEWDDKWKTVVLNALA